MFGDKCRADFECAEELNLECARNELRTCRCRRGYVWNIVAKTCYMMDDQPYDNGAQFRAYVCLLRFTNRIAL
jgi:hypothetical protein